MNHSHEETEENNVVLLIFEKYNNNKSTILFASSSASVLKVLGSMAVGKRWMFTISISKVVNMVQKPQEK